MFKITQEKANMICRMDEYLNNVLQNEPEKLWKNNFIKRQIDKRNQQETFLIEDHIRAIVYSMLSSGIAWNRIAEKADTETGYIKPVDDIFCDYDPSKLLKCSPEHLRDELKQIRCASQYTRKQMNALISVNIPKLLSWEKECGSVDTYYYEFGKRDKTLITLVKNLSDIKSKDKMTQMDTALVCEYLRNVGYNIPKPDRHIRRILGRDVLTFSEHKDVPVYEVFDIISQLAEKLEKSAAEIDYILWAYCSSGYGEICTVKNPKCDVCIVKNTCNKIKKEKLL